MPYGLAEDTKIRLAPLAARGDVLTTGINLWFQKAVGGYVNFGNSDTFALRGHVVSEYPASTRIIDEQVRLEIQFDGVDQVLDDELALEDALDNTLLLFAGPEILSGFDVTLLGAGHYRLSVVRGRYDTKRKTHAAGEEVFVVRSVELYAFLSQTTRSPANYKLQPFILQHELDLASVNAIPVSLQYRARRPLYPLNLRVNGDGCNPTYASGEGVSVDWDWSDARRNVEGPVESLSPDIDRTVIEILALGGLLMATHVFPSSGPQTITNTQIVNALGAEYHFILRAWFESNGRRSLESDSVTVRKV